MPERNPEDIERLVASEAGGVAWVWLHGTRTAEDGSQYEAQINITSRHTDPKQALDDIVAVIQYAEERYKLRPYSKQVRNRITQPSSQPTPPTSLAPSQPPQTPPPPTGGSVPATDPTYVPVNSEGGDVRIDYFTVVPQPDGRSQLEFWQTGRRYSELRATLTPEQAAAMFREAGEWTPAHFQTATTYTSPLQIGWIYSQNVSKSTGRPYRNIASIRTGA